MFFMLSYSLLFYIMGTIFLYASLAAVHVTNQSIVFKLNQQLKSRLNAIYMTGYFVGGAVGTCVSIYMWKHFGWNGVCSLGLLFALLTLWCCVRDMRYAQAEQKLISP